MSPATISRSAAAAMSATQPRFAGATSVPGVAQGTIPVAGTAAGTPGPVAQGGGAGGSSGQAGDQRPWPRSGVDQPIHKVYVAAFLRAPSAGSSVRPTRTSVIEPLTRRFVGPPGDCEAPRSGYTLVGANDDIMTRAVVMHWSGVGRSVHHDRKGQCHAVPHRICSIRVPVMIYWASRTATTCSGFTIGQIGGIMGRCGPAECDADS
jgi:hypothetical protein